jgi:acyl-CoA synthetase (NDP forming)
MQMDEAKMKNEIDSKALFRRYGFQTTEPMLAVSAPESAQHAARLGRNVAMKIVSADIVHKAAAGGVALDVQPSDAEAAYQRLVDAARTRHPDAVIDGVLVEEMVPPGIEIILGARHDNQFGGVVLLGFGGTNVERGPKPELALTPVTEKQARDLVARAIECHEMIEGTMRDQLVRYVLAVAGPGGMLEAERVSELDVNPIILGGGRAIAVDGVVSFRDAMAAGEAPEDMERSLARRRAGLRDLGALFAPKAIAFVGASTVPSKLGYRIVRNMRDFGYQGSIYPIHPSAPEICGIKAYPTIESVPGPVDRAFITVGAAQVPAMLSACARKGVQVAQVLTAGFSEWSGEHDAQAGDELEGKIKQVLTDTSMRMVGPNCIGTFASVPRIAMGAPRSCPTEPGSITFISQSGTFAGDVVRRARVQGLPVGQVLSCGNCLDLDLLDYLLFCEGDPNTRLIAFYAESIPNPALFFRAAERVTKPIVMLKGGTTEQGQTAASSHTAALATDAALWAAAVDKAGILQVDSIGELMDALLIFAAHGALRGNRLGIFGSGGGVSVTTSDAAARVGMSIAPLAPVTASALRRFGVPGTSVANPIDIPVWGLKEGDRYILEELAGLLKHDPSIDSIICYIEMGSIMDFADSVADGQRELAEISASVRLTDPAGPKLSLVLRSAGDKVQDDFVREQRTALLPAGIAVFGSAAQAVRAHAKLLRMTRPLAGVSA